MQLLIDIPAITDFSFNTDKKAVHTLEDQLSGNTGSRSGRCPQDVGQTAYVYIIIPSATVGLMIGINNLH